MIRLYKETEEFGLYSKYDTATGQLSEITKEQFNLLKQTIEPCHIFTGDCPEHTSFPRRIYFQITRRCNLLCPYCFIKANSQESDLPINVIHKLIPYLESKGLMEVRLTGGEPTLIPDFSSVVEDFQKHNIYVSVATNGLWRPDVLDFFCRSNHLWLIISIDGGRITHNRYRSNSYDTIVSNLIYLREHNPSIRIRLNTVLTRETIKDIESMFQLAQNVNAESVTFIPLRPQVREDSIKSNMLTAYEFKSALEDMVHLKKIYHVNFTTTIEALYKEEIYPDKIFTKKSSCAAGREGINLDYDYEKGEFMVYGCSYSPASDKSANPSIRKPFLAASFPFDNFQMLDTFWQDNEKWTLFRNLDFKSNDCSKCSYYKKRCIGSCPIQNINYSQLQVDEDMIEQLHAQMKQNGEWYCYKNFM